MTYQRLRTDIVSPEANEVYPQVASVADDDVFWIEADTNLTDILTQASVSEPGLLVSERLGRLLAGYHVQGELRPVVALYREERHPYFWLRVADELEEKIDFARSEFLLGNPPDAQPERIELHDREAFDRMRKRLIDSLSGDLSVRRVALRTGVPAYDLLYLRLTTRTYFVSRELAEELHAAGLTGFELDPATAEFVLP